MAGYLLIGIIMAICVAVAASAKGRTTILWFAYALVLWPVALIHVLVAAPNRQKLDSARVSAGELRKCPACAELVKPEARICRFCRTELPPDATAKPAYRSTGVTL